MGAILRAVKGIEVSEHTLSYDVIRDVVMGVGHFLGHPQTFSRMKSDYFYPEIDGRRSMSEWQDAGARDACAMVCAWVQKILSTIAPPYRQRRGSTAARVL